MPDEMGIATDSGTKVGIAFRAVRQCHQDVGRLIADFDRHMTKVGLQRPSDQDAVTWGISRASYAPYWMAKQLYRLYFDQETPGILRGLNIRFFSDHTDLREPRLIVGWIEYKLKPDQPVREVASTWDLDDGYHKWCNAAENDLGQVLTYKSRENGPDKERVARLSAVATNLYQIQKSEDVNELLQKAENQFKQMDLADVPV